MTNKIKIVLLIAFWAAIFFVAGMCTSKAAVPECTGEVEEILIECGVITKSLNYF